MRKAARTTAGVMKEREASFNLIILGDPASGKGTQSALLAKRYGMYDLDMGREVMKPENMRRYDYAHTTAVGKLTPTAVARRIFRDKIAHTPVRQGIVFSGTPKMIGEAKLVERLLREHGRSDPLVVYVHIPTAEVLRRMRGRRIYVHGRAVKRDDDNERALANRRAYYRKQVSKVVAFFRERYRFRRISGMGTEAEVASRVESAIVNHLKRVNNGRKSKGK